MIRQEIKNLIEKVVKKLYKIDVEVSVERPESSSFGDYSTNVAMALAKEIKKNPLEIARIIELRIKNYELRMFEKIETAAPGFINFFVSKEYLQKQVGEILKQKDKFGNLKIGKNQKINVEFISANPTGPLHIGNGRGGFCGDTLSNVLAKAGYKPLREYYVNDRGRQIKSLQDTLSGNVVYKNEYTDALIKKEEKDVKKAIEFIVAKIKKTTERMGVKFDKWLYESELYEKKETDKILQELKKKDLIYEKEGAVWFKSAQFGDDKDRVLVRAQEKTAYQEETYLLSDIAYLKNKFQRGFKYLIIFLGAEHHGYVPRLKAAVQALGYDKNQLIPIVFQLVRLIEAGKEVKMSKRSGVFITIDELLDEIPLDAARFFFLTRGYGVHLNFDLDLAKEQSEKNPVYYVQYAHARICSIIEKLKIKNEKLKITSKNLKLLTHQSELNLIKQLIRLSEIVEDTAKDYQVQRLPQYALDLAAALHAFYRDCRVLTEDGPLSEARLGLILAAKIVLKNTLVLMGISAPEKM